MNAGVREESPLGISFSKDVELVKGKISLILGENRASSASGRGSC